ncbi:Acetyltransferase (GNAT) family protein [Papillibacter cinnamivorans DSM 12816]|uniref:Acetyltransferase (GNAT) family protein n=1 Tax=Papillibacter cinnamivorans DSM 12816 TaxID=1122930 RepID=A0A1W2A9V9_9FIRM|nr:Acetyltransferase (GNAT) family protein [Papillibacter cinnamivorans DSM 12816]
MKDPDLYRVQKADEDKLVTLLTECFSKDPLYCQLIPQSKIRNKLLPEIFSCDLDELFETCEVYADGPALNGIIIVSDETEEYDPVRYYVCEAFYILKIALVLIREDFSLKTLLRFFRGKPFWDSAWTDELGNQRRMHIVYFAVRPSARGQGVSSRLMKSVLQYADSQGLSLSLETHNTKNVGMYQHYGFRLVNVLQQEKRLRQYCMVR